MAMEKWYQRSGEQDDIIVSTRVRLARNVADLPFPGKMTDGQREELAKRAEQALEGQALRRLDLAKLPRYAGAGPAASGEPGICRTGQGDALCLPG